MVHFEGGHIKFFSRKTLYEMLSRHGFGDFKFLGAGRLPLIWMSMIVRATRW
jgi:2-polyprenyl-6-hydroxyphenyl methylase/3-demethylubiquinone-9 3-methyltransferase